MYYYWICYNFFYCFRSYNLYYINDERVDLMYTVVIEFLGDPKAYEFELLENAVEIYKHAISNGVNAYIIDEFGDILNIK